MKKLLLILLTLSPVVVFASDVETDIVERTVNFIIFVSIFYYILADKAKVFFGDRTSFIQSELERVKDLKVQSEAKMEEAREQLQNAKQLAIQLVEEAQRDIELISKRVEINNQQEILRLSKSFEEKCEVETKQIRNEVVEEILHELISDENINMTQNNLTTIILNKVA